MRPLPLFFLLVGLAAAACSDANDLGDATVENVEGTDTLWALVGTSISLPSGYSVQPLTGTRRVRTDLFVDFDFAYNIQGNGQHVFLPRASLGIDTATSVKPGFILRNETFEAIEMPASDGYTTDDPVPLAVGQRYVVRSRVVCANLGVPKYAKLEILELDDIRRIVTFRILANDNCGFRSLEPGLPDR
jgi:hypothetical protein